MAFFSKTLDKLKGALRKTWAVLNTDVRTLFVPGRQIDEAFLADLEEKFIMADMGVKNVEPIVAAVREQWRMGRIRNAEDAKGIIKEQLLAKLPAEDRELQLAAVPSVILVAGVNGAGEDDEHREAGVAAEEPDEQEGDGGGERHVSGGRR